MWRRNRKGLEAELRAHRPEPRPELISEITSRVQGHGRRSRAASLRVAFAGAMTAVMLIAFAGFGGAGYAASAAGNFVNAAKFYQDHGAKKAPKQTKAKKALKAKKGVKAKKSSRGILAHKPGHQCPPGIAKKSPASQQYQKHCS